MRICCPVLGISPDSSLGGEIHDREVLVGLANLGVELEILLPKGKKFPKNEAPRLTSCDAVSSPPSAERKSAETENRIHPRPKKVPWFSAKEDKNFHVSFTSIKHIFPPYIFNFFVFFYLLKMYKRKKFDLIRVHNPYFVGPAVALFKKFYKIPAVATYHHLEDSTLKNLLDKILINQWEAIITPSQFTKEEIIKKYKVPASKVHVLYSGVDLSLKKQPKNQSLIKKYHLVNRKVLLFFSRLLPRKNPEFVLKVFKQVKTSAILIFMGDGFLRRKLEKLSKKFKLNHRVVFLGEIKNKKDKNTFLNLADIFLFPSKKEGFGMAPAEAMLCEKCVIASNLASLPELIENNKTGFLLNLEAEKWAKKIDFLLSKPEIIKNIGKKARLSILKRFSWQKTVKKNYQLYQELIK